MEPSTAFRPLLFDRARRCLLAAAGMLLFSFANCLQLQACIGLSPWFSLNEGLARTFPITYGQASLLISALIVVVDLLLREPIGLGTLINAVVGGLGSDLFLQLNWIPAQTFFPCQLAMLLAGIVLICISQYIYMRAGLSCGPWDAFLVALGRKLPQISIGKINLLLLTAVQVVALLLGGPFGAGTFITIFFTGTVMDLVFKVLHFEPRSVRHENLAQTAAAFRAALTNR